MEFKHLVFTMFLQIIALYLAVMECDYTLSTLSQILYFT